MKGQSQHKQLLKEFLDIMNNINVDKFDETHALIREYELIQLLKLSEKVEKCLSGV
jgi:hypothetical protein